jgi:hypothetical protein
LRGSELWGNPGTLVDHFARHGADFGARTAGEYSDAAAAFLQRSQVEGLATKIDARGVIRVYDEATNTFGAFNPSGTTRTFYKPDPKIHGYQTNLDYWNAQPRVAPVDTVMANRCPVCGFVLEVPAWDERGASDEICPSCGIQFGYDDAAGGSIEHRQEVYEAWRQRWIEEGMPWRSVGSDPPANRDPKAQLAAIGIDVRGVQ